MIAEIIPEAYDVCGKKTFYPRKKRFKYFAPNFPMGRYLTQPLSLRCRNMEEIRNFIKGCRYVSDKEQFGVSDFWMPPEEFEQRRRGDCDDFALWVWRQLIAMGIEDPRFVAGLSGRYGIGHSWLTFREGKRAFLLDPMAAWRRGSLPRLYTVRYIPLISVSWDGEQISYHEHKRPDFNPPLLHVLPLFPEVIAYRFRNLPRFCLAWGRCILKRIHNRIRRQSGNQ